MNSKEHKLAFIGGDARQLIAASRFRRMGYKTVLYGFGDSDFALQGSAVDSACCSSCFAKPHEIIGNVSASFALDCGTSVASVAEAVDGADAVILPLPASTDGERISTPLSGGAALTFDELLRCMNKARVRLIAGGKLPDTWADACTASVISVFDYYESEEFAIANAIPTAEGALEIAMRELPITLNGSTSLVIGYGRIGKVLSRLLKAVGSDVTVSARKPRDMAWIKAYGHNAANTDELYDVLEKRFDVIFNTVPHTVLDERALTRLCGGTLIIDLASKPGGVDITAAERRSVKVVWALSLPGKVAPVTSGEIIADTVEMWLSEKLGGG